MLSFRGLMRPSRIVDAHCDIPCGIYDPEQARIEAESCLRILEKYEASDDPLFKARCIHVTGIVSSLVQSVPLQVWLFGLILLAKAFVFFYLVISMPVSVDEVRRTSTAGLGVALVIIGIGAVE